MNELTQLAVAFPSLAILFFLWRSGLITFKGANGKSETPEWANKLTTHYNDETTVILRQLVDTQERLAGVIEKNNALDSEVLWTLKEMRNDCKK